MARTFTNRERWLGRVVIWLGVALGFVASGVAYAMLPDKVPNLFTLDSSAMELVPKNILLFILPIASLVMATAMELAPYVDPHSRNYTRFEDTYYGLRVCVSLVFLVLTIMHMIRLRYYESNLSFIAFKVIVAITIMLVGNVMPKLKPNYFVGFVYPWCIADERIWAQTHRFGGRYFLIVGILMAIVSFIDNVAGNAVYACMAVTLLIVPMVYAGQRYYLAREKENN